MAKTGPNEPCPCGKTGPDGRRLKYKRCCRASKAAPVTPPSRELDAAIRRRIAQFEAEQRIRQRQQGLGKPIIATQFNDHQVVAVRNRITVGKWQTFPDFLKDYIQGLLDPAWMNAELAKPYAEQHIITQWAQAYRDFQLGHFKDAKGIKSAPITGIVACFLMLAYNLYLIDHNVELQARMITRLKNRSNFQGAYYELMVASILIRAGFELTLIDESKRDIRNCEFTAVSKDTGKKYWIEAKMKGVSGLMGKTDADGSKDENPISHLATHLADALGKPAPDERMIFIDLNADIPADVSPENPPAFLDAVETRLKRYSEVELKEGQKAYVFVTCASFHRDLVGQARFFAQTYGLAIPDFNFRGPMRPSELYRQRKRHADATAVGQSFLQYLSIPATFDGALPSEQLLGRSRLQIGSTYRFESDGNTLVGTVTSADVFEHEKQVYVGVQTLEGEHVLWIEPMTDAELHDFKQNRDAYFGQIGPMTSKIDTPMEKFEWLMQANRGAKRETMLNWFAPSRDKAMLSKLSDEDLFIEYCEAMTVAMVELEQQDQKRQQPKSG